MEDSHGREMTTRQVMKVTKEVPVLLRLFSYSWSELQWLLTAVRGLCSAQAKAALGMPRALTPQEAPTAQKALSLAQHPLVLCTSAHLGSWTDNQADTHGAFLVMNTSS